MLRICSVFLTSVAFPERALLGVLLLAAVGTRKHELNTEGETSHATKEFNV